jgi:hypothetical protein
MFGHKKRNINLKEMADQLCVGVILAQRLIIAS